MLIYHLRLADLPNTVTLDVDAPTISDNGNGRARRPVRTQGFFRRIIISKKKMRKLYGGTISSIRRYERK